MSPRIFVNRKQSTRWEATLGQPQPYGKLAFGDESIRISAPIPTYLMAATVLPETCDLSPLAKLKPKGSAKLHWRELTDKTRRSSLVEVASIGGQTTLVAASPLPSKKQERGRRKCMELLLPELERAGVETLVLESRVLQLNGKDIDMIQAMRARKFVESISIDHAHASDEPRLWVPDQILGAYGDWLCNEKASEDWGECWEEIFSKLTVLEARM